MPEIAQQTGDPNKSQGTPTKEPEQKPTTLQVGEKAYTVDDVKNLLDQQASATQKTQDVAAVLKAAEKYGMDPETLITQAEGAFGALTTLMNAGIVDDKGNLLEKKGVPTPGVPNDFAKYQLNEQGQVVPMAPETPPLTEEGILKAVSNLMEEKLDPVQKALKSIDNTQTSMIRVQLEDGVKAKHSNLSSEDVSRVFASSLADQTKTVWEHAEVLANLKTADANKTRKEHADEFGVDLAQFDANKLNEGSPDGGMASFVQGKKFSFSKKDKNAVSPGKAADEFFRKRQM